MIFRIYDNNNARNTNTDGWVSMNPIINEEQIQTIQDPNGGKPNREITSIPSPWGRLDLIRTAFRNIVSTNQIEGKTLDHKLVSDTLDVAQIYFHLARLRTQGIVDCVRWDRQTELRTLSQSNIKGHRELERAWSKYLTQDEQSFNFDLLEEFSILTFIHPQTKARTVLGATSPITLFFPGAGNLSVASEYITFGQDHPFDGDYCPLTKREDKFIVWLYAIKKHYTEFPVKFKELSEYMDLCIPNLRNNIQAEINQLGEENYTTTYRTIEFAPGQPIQILRDLPIYVDSGNNAQQISTKSDFVIRATKRIADLPPLVLPTSSGFATMFYVSDRWDPNTKVSEEDTNPLKDRILPADGSVYPYLTIGDFLENKLIRLKNSLNESHFYAGEFMETINRGKDSYGYLLPLKPLFFEYFTVRDLIEHKMLSFAARGTSIEIKLCIPTRKGVITYTRLYQEPIEGAFGMTGQTNTIEEIAFELGMIHTGVYTPLCYTLPRNRREVTLRALSIDGVWRPVQFESPQEDVVAIYTSAIKRDFDALQVRLGTSCNGMIVPLPLPTVSTNRTIEYAVDLGTTNTCIAYKIDNETPHLLSWSEGQMSSILTTFNNLRDSQAIIESRLSLASIGDGLHKFPLRTALRIDRSNHTFQGALLNLTPSLDYQYQDVAPTGSTMTTDVKWSSVANDINLKAYIYGLCIWLRRHADVHEVSGAVRITWLYPSSMPRVQQARLSQIWEEATREFFGDNVEVKRINEAVAPYYRLSQTHGVMGRTVAMDIGGGTVDILITGNNANEPMFLTSSRMGANILYMAPAHQQGAGSGFAQVLKDYLEENITKDHKEKYLSSCITKMNKFIEEYKSEEAVDSFFSLARRFEVERHNALNMRLSDVLGDENNVQRSSLRTLVLMYFTLQVYHVAELMYVAKIGRPNGFVFSGNGSRILSVLGDEGFLGELISAVYGFIAEKYGNSQEQPSINARYNAEPKESTTYGAISPGANNISPIPCLLAVGNKYTSNNDDITFSEEDVELMHKDIECFAQLFGSLDRKLRLSADWGYNRESLDLIRKMLLDRNQHNIIFQTDIQKAFQQDAVYSQNLVFSLMEHRIREIGLSIIKDK